MPDAPVINGSGKVALDDAAFGARFNEGLVYECVRAELAALRQGTASTKTRGEVRGGGAKPWRQKGTGRARAGSIRSPIWSGGGTVFGPKPRRYTVKVNRKARRAALRSALSLHAGRGSLGILETEPFGEPRTKQAADALAKWGAATPVLVVFGPEAVAAGEEADAVLSFRNLEQVQVRSADEVGVADLMRGASVALTRPALEALTERATRAPRRTPEEAAA